MIAPLSADELERIQELNSYDILDTLPEQAYDDVTLLASQICHAPIALVSLVDANRQWFKARVGLIATETPRDVAFCAHAILNPDRLFIIEDASRDERFTGNPLVTGHPGIAFYAGAPLRTPSGRAMGTLCVIDHVPRKLTKRQRLALLALSRQVVAQLELRRSLIELRHATEQAQQQTKLLFESESQLKAANAALELLSSTDALTGLRNRRGFDADLDLEIARARRYGHSLALIFLDLDGFKAWNDCHGHLDGDQALRTVSDVLKSSLRSGDSAYRFGGDEFAVVLANTNYEGAFVLADRVQRRIQEAFAEAGPMGASFGIATYTEAVTDASDLVCAADRAMYVAKRRAQARRGVKYG